tara:strand:+ start:452 stop:2320 length:1869 start_codon:yes stop_codon:yes gene_type:complete
MINKGDRIGLVGKNGAGKSTLLNLLSKKLSPNQGEISKPNSIVIGYLTQDLDFEDGRTVLEEAEMTFENLNIIKKELDFLTNQVNERTDYESKEYLDLINKLHDTEEKFRMQGGYDIQSNISQVLTGLGFSQNDFTRQTTEFSGGWRMRIELAKILLKKPDLLLLDEPTNHLDIESIIWLENWLTKYTGAIVLVSHDRYFLDTVSNRTIEIAFAKINDYKASYSKYLELREGRIEKQIQAKKNQDRYIKQTKDLINKFRAKKNKAAFAQSLITKLERLEIINVEKEDVAQMQFRFPPAPRSGKVSLKVDDATKHYDTLEVLNNINLEVVRGEKIAFVGKNGEGKTTLAKMIVNEIDFQGTVDLGHNVELAYYAQNQSDFLDEDLTILENIENAMNENVKANPRTILGSFLFSNDDVLKKVKVLSGGERARVALCRLLLQPCNLLIMDEPTNHLDITSKELLKQALLKYDGSLIVVSHDREFLQGLTDKVYEFLNKNIKEYIGDVNAFLSEKNLSNFNELEKNTTKKDVKEKSHENSYHEEKSKQKEIRKLQNQISSLEKEINYLDKSQKEVNEELTDPNKFKELSMKDGFFVEYEKNQKKLKSLEDKWEELVEKLDRIKNKN